MTRRRAHRSVVLAFVAVLTSGCGGLPTAVGTAGIDQLTIPTPSPDPADFAGHAANVWFPLQPGTRWTYRQRVPATSRILVVAVLPGHRRIDGVATTAVRWQVRRHGHDRTALVRWYAVDSAGDVWWFGQRVTRGAPRIDVLAPRSWRAGRAGAEAGLVLSATPRVGDGYLNGRRPQVFARRSTVESVDAGVATPRRTYRHVVLTQDLSALAPSDVVTSYFVRGIGLVAQNDVTVASSRLTLVGMHPGVSRLSTAD